MAPVEEPAAKKQKTGDAKDKDEGSYSNTNGMPRANGRVLHLGLTDGELAHRVCVVGHHSRAELLSQFLEPEQPDGKIFKFASDRGFLTYTGMMNGKRLSVVSVGMGLPMMDFFVREARAVVPGEMAVVRFGTCGCLRASVPVGSLSVATPGSILIQRNVDHFHRANSGRLDENEKIKSKAYSLSQLCPPDKELNDAVVAAIVKDLGKDMCAEGVNVTADSFYGAQGRADKRFLDCNEDIIDEIRGRHPDVVSMEMESFQLLHMAASCQPAGSMRAAAAVVNVANRPTGAVVPAEDLKRAEKLGGLAVLHALSQVQLKEH